MGEESLSGQLVPGVDPISPSIMEAGNAELAAERDVLYRAWVRDSTAVRSELVKAETNILRRLEQVNAAERDGFFRANRDRLTEGGKRTMRSHIQRNVNAAFGAIESDIEESVGRAMLRAQRSQEAYLRSLGRAPLTSEQRQEIRAALSQKFESEFPPGSGMNYRSRLQHWQQHHIQQLEGILDRVHGIDEAYERMSWELRQGLTRFRPGSPIRGGSAYKKARRLMVAEETRMANEAELAVIRASGGEYAYWRLNAAHPWYGGTEICEVLAGTMNIDVYDELRRKGIDITHSMAEGLYSLSAWPDYPHPYCKCYPEPWFPL